MPATNFNWSLTDQQPIFQVYGTKRKNCIDVEVVETKRRCTESLLGEDMHMVDAMDIAPHPQSTNLASSSLENSVPHVHENLSHLNAHTLSCSQPPMHSNSGIQHLAQHHLQVTMNNRVPPLLDATGDHLVFNNNNNNNMARPSAELEHEMNNNDVNPPPPYQNEMLMDLHDDVYTTASVPELNPQTDAEYEAACSMMASMEGEGAPNPQQYSITYCDKFCVGGHLSPSGKVRCFCKPSWEGLADMRPYVSDYY